MTQPDRTRAIPDSDKAPSTDAELSAESGAEEDAAPEPEPWTPERASEWNAYYDIYVMLGVLLLAFIAGANRITHSSIWSQLQVGRVIAQTGAPVTTDLFSYTEGGKPWVNVSWLTDLGHASAHKLAFDMAPIDPTAPIGSTGRADQFAAGALVALAALARLLTAFFLLRVRHKGPGLWWSSLCVLAAVGTIVGPTGVLLGGIAGPGIVGPTTWGLLLLAIELWLLHRAENLGGMGSAYALVPLFALWANVDDSFLVGLLFLASATLGKLGPRPAGDTLGVPLPKALGILGACAAACLLNPSHVGVFVAALGPFLGLFRPATDELTYDQLSYFGQGIRQVGGNQGWFELLVYFFLLTGLGYFSFWLNRQRFSLSRFLTYTVAVVLWGTLIRFGPEFALVWAVTLALNGQEWYQGAFGREGRIGLGWSLWSVGGRAVTILLVFTFVGLGITGFGKSYGDAQFGFGYDPGDFDFEAADFLKSAPLEGAVLNTTTAQGDALIWRAYPERKTYIDTRSRLFPPEVLNRLQDARRALSEDDVERWRPLFDDYKISAVMIQASRSPNTLRVLAQSPNWIPFYDDGNVMMFGRTDASKADVAFFQANRQEPDELAYSAKRARPTPTVDRPPSPVTWMDKVFQERALARPQPHTQAAMRWMSPPSSDPALSPLPDPARCLVAIREARTALASKPDDTAAYRVLAAAYRALMLQESALLSGISLGPENTSRVTQVAPRIDLLSMRFRQRVTALNYAIQTTPPPTTAAARRELQALNLELFQLFVSANFVDMARDRLAAILETAATSDFTPEARAELSRDLAQFDEQVKQIQTRMTDLSVEQQVAPIQMANFALGQGAPGMAIHELEDADRTGTTPALVKPQLLDLYCETGQPEKAVEMLSTGSVEDPVFGGEPGVSAMRQGRAYFLLGNNEYAATLWEKYAIPRLRYDRSMRALGATQSLMRGDAKSAASIELEMPDKVGMQAQWEFDAGLGRLEGGAPELAADHFTRVLTLTPNSALRPLLAYYLEKLGKPVPPKPETPASATTNSTPATPAATRGAEPKPKVESKTKDEPKAK